MTEEKTEEKVVLRVSAHPGGFILGFYASFLFALLLLFLAPDHFDLFFFVVMTMSLIAIFLLMAALWLYVYKLTCTGKDVRGPTESSPPGKFRNPMPLEDVEAITIKKWPFFDWGKITFTDRRGNFLEFAACSRPEFVKFQVERLVEQRKSDPEVIERKAAEVAEEAYDREIQKKYFD